MPCRFKNKFSFYSTFPGNYSDPHQNTRRPAARYANSGHCGDRYCHSLLLKMLVEGFHCECDICCMWKWRRTNCVKFKHPVHLPTILLRYTISANHRNEGKRSYTGRMYKKVSKLFLRYCIYLLTYKAQLRTTSCLKY